LAVDFSSLTISLPNPWTSLREMHHSSNWLGWWTCHPYLQPVSIICHVAWYPLAGTKGCIQDLGHSNNGRFPLRSRCGRLSSYNWSLGNRQQGTLTQSFHSRNHFIMPSFGDHYWYECNPDTLYSPPNRIDKKLDACNQAPYYFLTTLRYNISFLSSSPIHLTLTCTCVPVVLYSRRSFSGPL